ncbi:hypothetical protein GCM10009800_24310 [Nocardiopsis rhodophaea]
MLKDTSRETCAQDCQIPRAEASRTPLHTPTTSRNVLSVTLVAKAAPGRCGTVRGRGEGPSAERRGACHLKTTSEQE